MLKKGRRHQTLFVKHKPVDYSKQNKHHARLLEKLLRGGSSSTDEEEQERPQLGKGDVGTEGNKIKLFEAKLSSVDLNFRHKLQKRAILPFFEEINLESDKTSREGNQRTKTDIRIDFQSNHLGARSDRNFWKRYKDRVVTLEPNTFKKQSSNLDKLSELASETGKKAKRSAVLNYFNSIEVDLFSKDEEKKIARRVKKGDEDARRKFIKHNLRLPISIAKKFRWSDLPFEDLIQAGNVGLIQAVDRFDPEKGNKFSTYATYWVKQRIFRSIHENRLIRLPEHIKTIQSKIRKERQKLPKMQEINKERIAEKTDSSLNNVNRAIKYEEPIFYLGKKIQKTFPDELGIKLGKSARGKINDLGKRHQADSFSGFNQISGKGIRVEIPFIEIINDPSKCLCRKRHWEILDGRLRKVLNKKLTDRKYRILILRYGFVGEEQTLEEVGKIFGVSRERIRQLQEKANEDLDEIKEIEELYKDFCMYSNFEPIRSYKLAKPWPVGTKKQFSSTKSGH